jgi:bifunctional DNA-binding transcriptional regulator/antitoxin component of YhaV-PrlF toxin-antitoxin module
MKTEIRKVDSQGRIVLPYEWRQKELKTNQEVIIIEEEGVLKIIPKKKIELKKFIDSVEFDEELIKKLDDWSEFEKALLNKK